MGGGGDRRGPQHFFWERGHGDQGAWAVFDAELGSSGLCSEQCGCIQPLWGWSSGMREEAQAREDRAVA